EDLAVVVDDIAPRRIARDGDRALVEGVLVELVGTHDLDVDQAHHEDPDDGEGQQQRDGEPPPSGRWFPHGLIPSGERADGRLSASRAKAIPPRSTLQSRSSLSCQARPCRWWSLPCWCWPWRPAPAAPAAASSRSRRRRCR